MEKDNIILMITKDDLQREAQQRIGRELTDEEIDVAKDGLDWGLQTCSMDIIYDTIFTEMM
jgi:hypothetical protein